MKPKSFFGPLLDKFQAEVIAPIIEKTIASYYAAGSLNQQGAQQWQGKMHLELADLLNGRAMSNKIESGFAAIAAELPTFLNPAEVEKIFSEWSKGVSTFMALLQKQNQITEIDGILSQMVALPPETMGEFYEAAVRLFKQQRYKKSADAFFVLATLDFRSYNVWLSLGLSEMQCGHIDGALYSFAMASINAINSPLPYLYSAECCLKKGQKDDAHIYLNMAEEALLKEHSENKRLLIAHIELLRQQLKA